MAGWFEIKEVDSPKKRTSFLDKDLGGALKKKLIRPKVSWEASLRPCSALLYLALFEEPSRSPGLVLLEGPPRRATASFTMNSPRSISPATTENTVRSASLLGEGECFGYLDRAILGFLVSPLHAPGTGCRGH